MADAVVVKLKPKHERRIAAGHPWVFSNEIDGDVSALPPGGIADVVDAKGRFLGRGYANPRSLISVRILSRARREDVDAVAFYAVRLLQAKALREAIYPDRRSLRLVFGEADGLPGLVVDRYDDVLAVQITTLGMEVRKPQLAEALQQVFAPRAAVLRNDMKVRELEGLEQGREVWFGDAPDEVTFDESGVRFVLPVLGGQKTGHFFDQHDNKRFAAQLCRGRTVLDLYSNTGGWALHALRAGAHRALCVDKDPGNAELCRRNAALNGVGDRLEAVAAEGKQTLQALVAEGRRFGAVVVDPPAFAKTRKVAGSALHGYRDVNALALTLIEADGFLFTSSCSHHVFEDRFLEAIRDAARDAGRQLQMVRRGEQASDHPVLPAVPETRYLKSFAFRVTMAT
jgi:23S rRNA (cytosine1962-C5)-methyltransferase